MCFRSFVPIDSSPFSFHYTDCFSVRQIGYGGRNAAERTGAGTGFGENGGSAEGGRPFAPSPEVDAGVPVETQRSGFGGERRSSRVSELSP